MPIVIRKIRNQDLYKVMNKETGVIHSNGTTLNKANAQKRLLDTMDGGIQLSRVGYKLYW